MPSRRRAAAGRHRPQPDRPAAPARPAGRVRRGRRGPGRRGRPHHQHGCPRHGVLRFVPILPLGGEDVTSTLERVLELDRDAAERTKLPPRPATTSTPRPASWSARGWTRSSRRFGARSTSTGPSRTTPLAGWRCRAATCPCPAPPKGRLTIAAANNIVIVANTTYATTGVASTDMTRAPSSAPSPSTARSPRMARAGRDLGAAPATSRTTATTPASSTPRPVRPAHGRDPYRVSRWAEIQNPSGLGVSFR
jgi:hypothetical protein